MTAGRPADSPRGLPRCAALRRVLHWVRLLGMSDMMEILFVKYTRMPSRLWLMWTAIIIVLMGAGCGLIADKSRIKIATMNGEPITRGDLAKVIREMAPDERPIIRTKGDVRKALENYIDTTLKRQLAEKLKTEGKLHVDRAIAEQVYHVNHPDMFVKMSNPQDYDLTEQDLAYMEEERQFGIDEELARLEAEQAVYIRISEAVRNGTMQVSDAEYQEEYNLRKADLKHFEKIAFAGVLIPGSGEDSVGAATAVRGRFATGEDAETIAGAYRDRGARILVSGLENDPARPKYAGFWQQAAGAAPGDILGPIFITGWEMERVNAQGQRIPERLPDGLLVCKVTDHVPPIQKTLDEAKPDLVRHILYGKMMEQLGREAQVDIFEHNLPDPSVYETKRSIVTR